MNKILNFIFSKKDEGIYRTYRIFGIKIITKPIRLKLDMIEDNIIHKVNNHIDKIYFYPFIDKYINIQKDKYNYDIENILQVSKKIFFAELQYYLIENDKLFIKYLFKGELQFFNDFHSKADIMIIWGMNMYYHNARTIEMALATDTRLLIAEDGFIRSINNFVNKTIPSKYRNSISFTFSNLPHFFADEITTLEYMLNNEKLKLDNKQIERAKYLIDKIIKNKISKYNHQPIYKPEIGKNKNKVLVIDQSYGDMSISYGWANEYTFKNMLEVAIKENYNADIIIKTHPDALVKNSERAKCYYSSEDIKENVYLMAEEINPISLLEIVDKVYVCTSQLGFEALMLGKEVHVFGMPFYAGYGLTIDYQKCERRKNNRTLEEIFYITYINYSYYVNPEKEERCEIEEAIDYLIKLRREYFLEFNIRCDDKNIVDLSERDFSLNSGERQTAQTLEGIRKDHLFRYELASNFLEKEFNQNKTYGADIFCGNGYGSYVVASKLKNTKILSIDASKEAIELANNYYKIENRIKFINKFFPFELEKDKYDYIISFESIEHIQDDIQFIETIISAIKNNGYWFLSTPNEEKMSLKKNNNKFHFRHYTNKIVNDIFKKYNLKVIEQYGEDTYSIDKNGLITGTLSEDKMKLIKDYKGQFMVYILRVVKE
ncbi:methyltransferase domain-containing protein [uncultured Brachyspira sp.]|uniref:capsular polysaccharide export protein, LipB/KpsS family n=1 Tax=uncultured Brachyspira sp. TaxID=221953 RepID=UPI00259B164D|nr:methyltransferase domain-containing protein [uncultured Brachyspira sp.]